MKKAVIILVLVSLLLTGCEAKKVDKLTDAERFANEYGIKQDNPFVYAKYDEIMNMLKNKKTLILLANSDDEKSIKAVKTIYKQAKKDKVEIIYYYNPRTLREKQPNKYKKLVEEIENKIQDYEFKLPTLFAVDNGGIVNYSDCFSKEEQLEDEYLTEKRKKTINEKYSNIFNYYCESDE